MDKSPGLDFGDLKGKLAVITGGAGVIGSALTEAMAAAGMKLAIIDINSQAAESTAQHLQERYQVQAIGVQANVLEKHSLLEAKHTINKSFGTIQVLVNGAGGNHPQATTAVEQMSVADLEDLSTTFYGLEFEGFEKVFALNFKGTVLPSMVFTTDMHEKGGVVLNISSMNSYRPLTKIPAYSAAKAAVNNFTQWLAVHLAKIGVRVNAIAPGFFVTNQNRFLLIEQKTGELTERGRKILSNTPMGRFGDVAELQGTVLYLLSDLSKFVTGVVIPVDGGYSAFGGV